METDIDYNYILTIFAILITVLTTFFLLILKETKEKLSEAKSEVEKAKRYAEDAQGYVDQCNAVCSDEHKRHFHSLKHLEVLYTDIETITYFITKNFPEERKELITKIDAEIEQGKIDIQCNICCYQIQYGNEEEIFGAIHFLQNHGNRQHAPFLREFSVDLDLPIYLQSEFEQMLAFIENIKNSKPNF